MSRVNKRFDAAGDRTKAAKSVWPTSALGDVCDVIGGGTPSKEIASHYGGTIPWATVRDMKADLLENTECSITTDAVQASATNIIPVGNVIIATRVGLGKVCILGQDTAINQDLRGIIPRNGSVKVKFLYHWLRYIAPRIVAEGSGATVQGVKLPFIKSLQMPVPPIPEQDRIVAILDEAFEGIAEAATNATKALHKTQTLFENYLQSVVNQYRPSWQQKSLAEISREYGRGKSKHRPRNDPRLYEGPYPFVQTGDISNANHWLTSYKQTYSEVGLAQSHLWPKGTVCIAIVGATVGETAILNFAACFPDSVIGIVVDERIADNEYVEYLLQASKSLFKEKGKGTARDNINLGAFEDHEFSFPPLSQQKGNCCDHQRLE